MSTSENLCHATILGHLLECPSLEVHWNAKHPNPYNSKTHLDHARQMMDYKVL